MFFNNKMSSLSPCVFVFLSKIKVSKIFTVLKGDNRKIFIMQFSKLGNWLTQIRMSKNLQLTNHGTLCQYHTTTRNLPMFKKELNFWFWRQKCALFTIQTYRMWRHSDGGEVIFPRVFVGRGDFTLQDDRGWFRRNGIWKLKFLFSTFSTKFRLLYLRKSLNSTRFINVFMKKNLACRILSIQLLFSQRWSGIALLPFELRNAISARLMVEQIAGCLWENNLALTSTLCRPSRSGATISEGNSLALKFSNFPSFHSSFPFHTHFLAMVWEESRRK